MITIINVCIYGLQLSQCKYLFNKLYIDLFELIWSFYIIFFFKSKLHLSLIDPSINVIKSYYF